MIEDLHPIAPPMVREDPTAIGMAVLHSEIVTREGRSATVMIEDLHPIVPRMVREDPTGTGMAVLHPEIVTREGRSATAMIEDLHPIVPRMGREDPSETEASAPRCAGVKTDLQSHPHVMRLDRKAG
jgi:hypothetical protein